jgi:molybdopterin-guanine dinucleotide biosynthesis protein A
MGIVRSDITGLVLAGGRGSRMGGVDKGLQLLGNQPLALWALRRLMPQVGPVAINANRNTLEYEWLGAPVWPDRLPDHPGPLAGLLTGMQRCTTPYLLTVPCDTPQFPADLAERLASALIASQADVAMAATRDGSSVKQQPVFMLVKPKLKASLAECLARGEGQVGRWAEQQRHAVEVFDDASAFANINTREELQRSQPTN